MFTDRVALWRLRLTHGRSPPGRVLETLLLFPRRYSVFRLVTYLNPSGSGRHGFEQ